MRRSSGPRKTANLSESVHQHLSMYALAAGAAGVGVLISPQATEARIVYTRAHVLLHGIENYPIDLNHDGHADFSFGSFNTCTRECFASFGAAPAFGTGNSNNVIRANGSFYQLALRPGARIGPRSKFFGGGSMLRILVFNGRTTVRGYWGNVTNRYLGLKFAIQGKAHFGWARLTVHYKGNQITSILSGYAYETIPGKAIIAGQTEGPDDNRIEEPSASLTVPAPQPATLGALAMGAPGLAIWRRKESVDGTQ